MHKEDRNAINKKEKRKIYYQVSYTWFAGSIMRFGSYIHGKSSLKGYQTYIGTARFLRNVSG